MRILFWYCSHFKISNAIKSSRAFGVSNGLSDINEHNVIVPWVTIESKLDGSQKIIDEVLLDVKVLAKEFHTNLVVLVPFVHLSEKIASAKISAGVFDILKEMLESQGFNTKLVHFGSHKDLLFESPANKMQVLLRNYPKPGFKNKV